MQLSTIFLLALLVSIDNFYAGAVYQQLWGKINRRNLLLIGLYNLLLFSLAVFLGKGVVSLLGVELAKLFSVALLLFSSIMFYLSIASKSKIGFNIQKRLAQGSRNKSSVLRNLKGNKQLMDLLSLSIVSSIDTVVASFLVAISDTQVLIIILSFTLINLFSMQLGNLVVLVKEDRANT
ncbi:hypothetical protein [Fuchsiella alkaliacetigena]|uniref:hypothetical protein n=1 Tax=Fuchsiella alkaliacetigena TaxID=957042 RepID=UPI00200A1FA7|nr:hypothetical protein [Fuchsiella alkaliacetigena]MCK8824453.1 hypothetical protein [Fuchsiella alkaliacetigena]